MEPTEGTSGSGSGSGATPTANGTNGTTSTAADTTAADTTAAGTTAAGTAAADTAAATPATPADLRAALDAQRASFRKAITKDHRDWTLWFELAQASRGRERADALHEASRLNPRSPEIAAVEKPREGR